MNLPSHSLPPVFFTRILIVSRTRLEETLYASISFIDRYPLLSSLYILSVDKTSFFISYLNSPLIKFCNTILHFVSSIIVSFPFIV